MKHYLLFANLSYCFSILRPIEERIIARGDQSKWFIAPGCPNGLVDGEDQLTTFEQIKRYNPYACIAAGNCVYDFFPGVKVCVFHGYAINKRNDKIDDHFTIRNWFDIYCTQGPSSTPTFKLLEQKHQFFRVYETGWPKADTLIDNKIHHHNPPTILYASTFSQGLSSAYLMWQEIDRLADKKPWKWIITLHPKITTDVVDKYKDVASRHDNVEFVAINSGAKLYNQTDVMLCDNSSIILEYMLTGRPVVTYRNHAPGGHLIDVREQSEIEGALEKALLYPKELMDEISNFVSHHEAHRDGRNSERVLEAIDDFYANYKDRIKSKPLNLLRKIKLRLSMRYFNFISIFQR